MHSTTPQTGELCKRCSLPLEPGALECAACHALVHADRMDQLAAQARELEARQDFTGARERWRSVLPLLPRESKQAAWIVTHVRELESAAAHPSVLPDRSDLHKSAWAKRLAPLGVAAALAAKFKTVLFALFKLKFLFSFAAFLGFYWAAWGMKFGLGFAALVLIHEMGHFVEIKRRGLPADMPVFLPGLGAYVRWQAMGVPLETRSLVALAGPCAGFLASVVCGLAWWQTGDPFWAALGRTSAWFNALNLIPVFILDGGHAIPALNRMERGLLAAVSGGLYYGTKESVFIFVGLGAVWQLVSPFFMARAEKASVTRLDLSGPGQTAPVMLHDAPPASEPSSPLIAAYFIGLLTALAAVLYLLPGQGAGLP
ncbi:MAG TPA: site-2 protease family protein [Terriglobales bacterium]|nr:site-2 protease family protein [Terriglobales bacterium]